MLAFYDSYKTRTKVSSIELLHSRLDVNIASNPSESYVNGPEGKRELPGAGRELELPSPASLEAGSTRLSQLSCGEEPAPSDRSSPLPH